jgi:exonuclease SbcC
MRIESIELDNIRSYDETNISFEDGLVLMYGENGAGKSSLLSSIFCGMYMSDVLSYMDDDINLDSLVRRGQEEGKIKLRFRINGDTYRVLWKISVREDDGERSASTKECRLTGSDIDDSIEGVRAVGDYIEEIVGLSSESFVNSVYVQQGNIARIIKSDGDQRKEIVDGLLGLSRLDTYINRMDRVRRELGAQKRGYDKLLKEKNRQLNKLPSKKNVETKLSNLRDKKREINDEISEAEDKLSKAEEEMRNYKSDLEDYKDSKSEIERLEEDIRELEERRSSLSTKKKNIESQIHTIKISDLKEEEKKLTTLCQQYDIEEDKGSVVSERDEKSDTLSEIESDITKIETGKMSTIESDISNLETRISDVKSEIDSKSREIKSKEEDIENLESDIASLSDTVESIEEVRHKKQERIKELSELLDIEYSNIEQLKNKIPSIRDDYISRIRDIYEELGQKRNQKIQFDELIENNICPICGDRHNSVDETVKEHRQDAKDDYKTVDKKTEAIDNQKKNLDELSGTISGLKNLTTKLDSKSQILENKREQLEAEENRLQKLNKDRDELHAKVDDLEDKISNKEDELEELEVSLEEKKEDKTQLESDIEDLESILSKFNVIEELKSKIEELQREIEQKETLRENLQENFLDKQRELQMKRDEYEDIDVSEYKNKIEKFQRLKVKVESSLEDKKSELSQIRDEIAEKQQKMSQIENIKSRKSEIQRKKSEASSQETDAEKVKKSYKEVKSKLRKENIGLLNKYANDVFGAIYDNKIYQRLEIDEEYNITLVTGDNIRVDPAELSGGETTLTSLAIRAGVYKLLVKRQGGSDTLPPFILDEPTTFLDGTHVSNLQNVIDKINSWDVSQVFIISHREDMIQNADSAYKVTKNPSTETSSVEKRY